MKYVLLIILPLLLLINCHGPTEADDAVITGQYAIAEADLITEPEIWITIDVSKIDLGSVDSLSLRIVYIYDEPGDKYIVGIADFPVLNDNSGHYG